MATTHTPISAANIPIHTRLNPLSPPSSSSSVVKCSNRNGDTKTLKTNNNGVGSVVLDGFGKPAQRNESTGIKKQETEAAKMTESNYHQLQAEIAQLQKQLSEARAMIDEDETERNPLKKKKEKLESVKAASISAIVGTLASLPFSLTHVTSTYDLTVSTTITIITCALYGATYRYTVRRDLDDFHLKTGTCAAFGIVKGVATLDGQSSLDALSGAICVSENVIVFLLAAAGLDICYKMGILSPFPVETRTKM
ncbi:hypothetical protein E3N88_16786 [Mikania micrantha]|uniref:Uncharacterized protein n=1 Tax=Mikania micrantha TaxID=192012 RepID=A0A5N6NRI7_9ASTR|nr:hypothetical protein E3N88_16786 [Mikania micrantha]